MAGAIVRSAIGSLMALATAVAVACASAPPATPASPAAPPPAPPAAAPTGGAAPAPTSGAAQAPAVLQKVRYGTLNIFGDAGIFIGMDEGFFAEQGIEIDTSPFDSAANMVAPLATNQLEVGGGATSAGLFNALRTGVNVRIVADKGHSDPTPPGFPVSIYLLRKDLADSRVKSVADLKGMRSAKPAQGISPELDLTAFLKQGGLTPGDLDMSIMSFPDMIPAFANRNLDFAWSVEPFATIALNQGNVVKMGYDYQVNPSNQVAVLLYSPEFSRSDLGTKFMVAYLRAIRVYNDGFLKREPAAREKVIGSLTRHTPVKDRALYDQMELSALDPDGKMDLHSFDEQQDYFLATGTQQARVDLSQFIDLQHIESAAAQLGPYR